MRQVELLLSMTLEMRSSPARPARIPVAAQLLENRSILRVPAQNWQLFALDLFGSVRLIILARVSDIILLKQGWTVTMVKTGFCRQPLLYLPKVERVAALTAWSSEHTARNAQRTAKKTVEERKGDEFTHRQFVLLPSRRFYNAIFELYVATRLTGCTSVISQR
jgi:hypothetical protein